MENSSANTSAIATDRALRELMEWPAQLRCAVKALLIAAEENYPGYVRKMLAAEPEQSWTEDQKLELEEREEVRNG